MCHPSRYMQELEASNEAVLEELNQAAAKLLAAEQQLQQFAVEAHAKETESSRPGTPDTQAASVHRLLALEQRAAASDAEVARLHKVNAQLQAQVASATCRAASQVELAQVPSRNAATTALAEHCQRLTAQLSNAERQLLAQSKASEERLDHATAGLQSKVRLLSCLRRYSGVHIFGAVAK